VSNQENRCPGLHSGIMLSHL